MKANDRLLLELAWTISTDSKYQSLVEQEYKTVKSLRNFFISALLQNTDLDIDHNNVHFECKAMTKDEHLFLKIYYKYLACDSGANKNQQIAKTVLLVGGEEFEITHGDTIRLLISRKYTTVGIQELIKSAGFISLEEEEMNIMKYRSSESSGDVFGMALMLLTPCSDPLPPPLKDNDLVFLSYSHKDNISYELCKYLERRTNFTIWKDSDDNKSDPNLLKCLLETIGKASCVILLCSENSLMSDWVNAEIAEAVGREEKEQINLIIPIDLDGFAFNSWNSAYKARVTMKTMIPLRENIRPLSEEQKERKFDEIKHAVEKLIACSRTNGSF
jgi:hypothetical protein